MAAVRAQRASAIPSYIFGALGGLLFGYDLGVVAGALLYLKPDFHLGPVEVGFVTSSLLLGAMIGALGCAGSWSSGSRWRSSSRSSGSTRSSTTRPRS